MISPETFDDLPAATAGLKIGNGIIVNERPLTSDAAICAAGDVANAYHPGLARRLRVEHWANARRQGAVAAKAMLGQDVVYDRQPYFFSGQYDLAMEYTGYVDRDEFDQTVTAAMCPLASSSRSSWPTSECWPA